MTARPPRLEWLPPLLVGVSAAVAAEVAMAVLLYGGPGFVRSLTTVLAVEGLALAGGLWTAPAPGPDVVDRVRRRWLACLFAFVAAAVFGTTWSLFPAVSEGAVGQGAGLALLGALPLYTSGSVLAGMAAVARTDPGGRLSPPGAAAAAGAALGFVLTGLALPQIPLPASLIVACLVLLSLGGMIYGGVLAVRTEVRVLGRRPGRGGEVAVEERRIPAADVAVRELREGPVVRRWKGLEGPQPVAWEEAVGMGVLAPEVTPRVLSVGGGASSVAGALLRRHARGAVEVLERTAAVVELGRDHFDTGLGLGGDGSPAVEAGNLDDAVLARDGSYELILVDASALEPIGGITGLSVMARRRLPALLAPGGVLAWGPTVEGFMPPEAGGAWLTRRYRRTIRAGGEERVEGILLIRRDDGEKWTPAVPGFKEIPPP